MFNRPVRMQQDGSVSVSHKAVEALRENGSYLPDVSRVIFGLDETGEYPTLTTTVFWADGTTTRVRNAKDDSITVEEKTLSDGSTVRVADRSSKERAICFATVKRTCGRPNEHGEIVETSMSRILAEIVDSACDQGLAKAEAKIRKAALKAASKEREERKTEVKTKRHSYDECVQNLGSILEAVVKRMAEDPEALNKIADALKSKAEPKVVKKTKKTKKSK